MRYIKIATILFCLSFIVQADENHIIEQLIAKNIDGAFFDFSFFYTNTTNSIYLVQSFLEGGHNLTLSTEKNTLRVSEYSKPPTVYSVPHGVFFVKHSIFEELSNRAERIKTEKDPIKLSWRICNQDKDSWCYTTHVCLAWKTDSRISFFFHNKKDIFFAEIIKLMDGNNLSFALLVANHTSKKIVLTDLYGDGNQVKLKFPNGRIFTPSLKKDAKNIELKPGESKTFKIELDQLLKENKDFSMKDFEFGLTELVWEIKLDKEQTITRNFWLVKFNGELPEAHAGSGYKLDGPLNLQTFRDKKISALPAPHAYFRNKEDVESETKETTENKESSSK